MRIFYILFLLITPYSLSSQTIEELKGKCKEENTAKNWNILAHAYYDLGDTLNLRGTAQKALQLAEKETNYEEMAEAWANLAQLDYRSNGEEYERKYKLALKYAEKGNKVSIHILSLKNLGSYCNGAGRYDEALEYFKESLNIFDDGKQLITYTNISFSYMRKGISDSAIYYAKKSREVAILEKDTAMIYENNSKLAILNRIENGVEETFDYYQENLRLSELSNNYTDYALTLQNIAIAYLNLDKRETGLEFAQKSIAYVSKHEDKIDDDIIGNAYFVLGNALWINDKYAEGIDNIKISLNYYYDPFDFFQANLKIIACYYKLNELDSCEVYLDKAKVILDNNKELPAEDYYIYKGIVLSKLCKYKESLPYLLESEKLASQNDLSNMKNNQELYNFISTAYELGHHDYKNAMDYTKKAYITLDSIYTRENNQISADFAVRYQTAEKELEISKLNEEQQRILYNRTLIVGGFISLVILLVVALTYNRIKRQNKEKEADELARKVVQKELEYKSLLSETESRLVKRHLEGRELERKSLAKELHDSVANDVVSIMVQSETNTDQEKTNLMLKKIYNEIRQISHQLMPPEFNYISLVDMLEDYTDLLNETAVIHFKTNILDADRIKLDELPNEEAKELYYILQEAIGNIRKHANATNVEINMFYNQNGDIVFSIADNGKGFDTEAKFKGIGLRTMKDRALGIGAILNIKSGIGTGTEITITLVDPKPHHQEK